MGILNVIVKRNEEIAIKKLSLALYKKLAKQGRLGLFVHRYSGNIRVKDSQSCMGMFERTKLKIIAKDGEHQATSVVLDGDIKRALGVFWSGIDARQYARNGYTGFRSINDEIERGITYRDITLLPGIFTKESGHELFE